jgi:PAS domain S-box-containing protein
MGIESLEDAIRFARASEEAALAVFVADWQAVAALFDREGLWDEHCLEAWLNATANPSAVLAPLLTIRYATPAMYALFQVGDLDTLNACYRQDVAALGVGTIQAMKVFRSGEGQIDFEAPIHLGSAYVRPVWLHRPGRAIPWAVTLLLPVAEGRAAEHDLRRSEARYRGIVQDQTDFIVRYRPDGVRTFVNDAYASFFGGRPQDFIGRSFLPLIAKEHHPAVEEKIRRLVEREADVLADEHLSIRHDGAQRWTHWIDRAIFDDHGNLIEIQAVGRDITEHKEAEQQRLLLEQRLAQTQKMEALGTLAGGLAHDFNNTLTGILGYAAMIRREAADRDLVARHAEGIREAAERACELVQNLLHLSRRPPRRVGECDVREIVGTAARLLRATIPRRIELAVEVDEIPRLAADAGQLTQALINLGLNAQDAIPGQGTITISAAVEREDEGELVVLRVRDDGDGMPDEVRSRIFEPFFTTKPEGKGSGLGLAMVYACAQSHGGRVEVASQPGEGTTMELRLPLVPCLSKEAPRDGEKGGAGETILLVDDDPLILLLSQMALQQSGYEVLTAAGADEAIARFADRIADLGAVVTDLVMAGGGGRELEAALHARRPGLPIVLATGGLPDYERGPFAAVLEKPFSVEELLQSVRVALDRSGAG